MNVVLEMFQLHTIQSLGSTYNIDLYFFQYLLKRHHQLGGVTYTHSNPLFVLWSYLFICLYYSLIYLYLYTGVCTLIQKPISCHIYSMV